MKKNHGLKKKVTAVGVNLEVGHLVDHQTVTDGRPVEMTDEILVVIVILVVIEIMMTYPIDIMILNMRGILNWDTWKNVYQRNIDYMILILVHIRLITGVQLGTSILHLEDMTMLNSHEGTITLHQQLEENMIIIEMMIIAERDDLLIIIAKSLVS